MRLPRTGHPGLPRTCQNERMRGHPFPVLRRLPALLSCLLAWGFVAGIAAEGWPTWVAAAMALPVLLT